MKPQKHGDLTGKRFAKLIAVEYIRGSNKKGTIARYRCICDCGNTTYVRPIFLVGKNTGSCGKCSWNTFVKKEGYYKGVTSDGYEFFFDEEDYKIVNGSTWRRSVTDGDSKALMARINNEDVLLHRLILDVPEHLVVDHIDGNPMNNRRSNLRLCTIQENSFNAKKSKNNTSGFTGVSYHALQGTWCAELQFSGKKVFRQHYRKKEDALINRVKAEIKYFGEFRSTRNDREIEDYLGLSIDEINLL